MQRFEDATGPKKTTSRVKQARNQFRGLRHRLHDRIIREQCRLLAPTPSSSNLLTSPNNNISNGSFMMRPQSTPPSDGDGYDDSTSTPLSDAMDGSGEKRSIWSRSSTPVGAIFVHAGAGYHSTTNENIHLGACADAAKVAMRVIRCGGTAVEAVEAAIRVLEDKEITNAGFGSNLTIEGIVECDATVVDHLGRSGACGAVAKIKNPIHLARVILEQSSRPLSLRRVPPNLLIGDGATHFGWEHGIDIVSHESLVSKNARDRYVRWREDLRRAGGIRTPGALSNGSSVADEPIDHDFEEKLKAKQRRDHYNALLNGTWNEGQPDSPAALSASSSPAPPGEASDQTYFQSNSGNKSPTPSAKRSNTGSPVHSRPSSRGSPAKRPRYAASQSSDGYIARVHSLLGPKGDSATNLETPKTSSDASLSLASFTSKHRDRQSNSHDGSVDESDDYYQKSITIAPVPQAKPVAQYLLTDIDEDRITDTVGAIAIDMFGNIAAGSSSGGIGMKHRGRVGPAALVGVGSAVIPVDDEDPDSVSVAAVTSGTGEHMATTMASQKCAERLYFNTKRGRGGTNAPATEEEAMESFVVKDFMDHPGVKGSHSAGAIGVMAVKKTAYGYYLHFAHNTDSFALASMGSNEKDPKCVMSRLGDYGSVVQGGRKVV